MKKIPIPNQLDLSKEIIASLSDEQLQEIEGGSGPPPNNMSCWYCSCHVNTEDETLAN